MTITYEIIVNINVARVLENIAKNLRSKYEIDVLALNYYGDPDPLQKQFNIYPAPLGGDLYGASRVAPMVNAFDYKMVFIINDIWIASEYIREIRTKVKRQIPIVTYTPVDAPHLKKEFIAPLNMGVQHAIFYTEFGRNEALLGGLGIPSSVISHGIDQQIFHMVPRDVAREQSGVPKDAYVVLMADRNQPRKRIDLGISFFAEWVKQTNKPDTVKLYYHGAVRDQGVDVEDVADDNGVSDRLILTSRQMTMSSMLPADKLKIMYSSADVFWKPCANEG